MSQFNRKPEVTVCVITYNQEKYIRQCLQSIVDQKTDFDFKVIVGEDCSTDATRSIVREFAERYPAKIIPIYQDQNIASGFHNFLMTHNRADGMYVAHVDGDDYLLPGKLQRQKETLDANDKLTAVWHRVNLVNDRSELIGTSGDLRKAYKAGEITLGKLMRYGMAGAHSSIMYRRSARITKNPSFAVMDLFYSLELLESGNGMLLNEVLGTYRVTSNSTRTIMVKYIRKLMADHISYFLDRNPEHRKQVFIFSTTNLLIDILHYRSSFIVYLKLALKSFCYVNPFRIFEHIKILKTFR